MVTANSTVKSVSHGSTNARRRGSDIQVSNLSRSGTPSARLKSVRYPQCKTQVGRIRANFGLDRLIRANFGLNRLIRAYLLDRAPHPGVPSAC